MYNITQDCAHGITMRQSSGNVIRNNWMYDTNMLWNAPLDLDNIAGMVAWRPRPVPNDHPQWGREVYDGICLWHTFYNPPSQQNIVMDNLVQVSGRSISIPMPTKLDPKVVADAVRIMCTDPPKLTGGVATKIDYKHVQHSAATPLNNMVDRNLYAFKKDRAQAGFALYIDKQLNSFRLCGHETGYRDTAHR